MSAYGFRDVAKFHSRFGLDNVTYEGKPGPRELDREMIIFRMRFLCEELQEFLEGLGLSFNQGSIYEWVYQLADWDKEKSHPQMFDALIDLVYVAYGTAHLLGYPWQEGWDLVQEANMAKIRATHASQSERGGTNDVIKPPGWTAPDIAGLLRSRGWDV